jgi:hypothetical protein
MKASTGTSEKLLQADAQIFWGEIAPSEHVVQIYESEQVFLDLLCGYVTGGIRNGDSVIVIATSDHILSLNARIKADGFDPFYLGLKDQYIPLDAHETLSKFMVDGWADEILFRHTIADVLTRAKRFNRNVRAFGEMVSILWSQGNSGATVQLEHLWNKFAESETFCLFCAYPKSGFTKDPTESLHEICCAHSKIIEGDAETNEISYYATKQKNAS